MKKVLLSSLVALTFVPSLAIGSPASSLDNSKVSTEKCQRKPQVKTIQSSPNQKLRLKAKSGREFNTLEDFVGEYEWMYNNLLSTSADFSVGVINVTIEDASTNTLILEGFTDPTFEVAPIKATVDLENKKFIIPNLQNLGDDVNGDLTIFYIKGFDENGMQIAGAVDLEAAVGTIEDGGHIVFPELQVWAWADPDNEKIGYWVESAYNTLDVFGDTNEGWEYWSEGTMADGWMLPGFDMNPFANTYSVTIERNKDSEGIYRIKNPYYGNFIYSAKYGSSGWIVFDISDKEFIKVEPFVRAGFTIDELCMSATNIAGYFSAKDFTKEAIQNAWPDVEWSSYSEGTVSFNDCRLNIKGRDAYMVWDDDLVFPMKGSIIFNKLPLEYENEDPENIVEEIGESSDVEEYFNLEGIRISEPDKGIYICRKGSKIQKIIR